MPILFSDVTVVPMDGAPQVLEHAYVAVEGTKIASVGTEPPEGTFDRVVDGAGKVLLPGFVNAHTHLPMTLMSGYLALKLEIRFWTVSSLPQPPMGYVHSLMLAPVAAALAAEEAVEEAVVVLEEEPPQAASAPAAPRIPAAFRNERREMQFFMIDSPCSSSSISGIEPRMLRLLAPQPLL